MSDLYTALVSTLLFPLHERLKGHDTVAVRRELEQTQWWPPEQLAGAAGASACAPCWPRPAARALLPRPVRAPGLRPRAASRRWPTCSACPSSTKAAIRAHTDALKHAQAQRPGALQHRRSSRRAADLLHRQRTRQPRRGRQVARHALVGRGHRRPRDRASGARPSNWAAQDRVRALRDRLLRTATAAGLRDVRGQAGRLRRRRSARQRPKMLFGYPSALTPHRAPCREARPAHGRPGHQGGLRHQRTPVRRPARSHRARLRLPGGQRLRRARRRLHRPRVPARAACT